MLKPAIILYCVLITYFFPLIDSFPRKSTGTWYSKVCSVNKVLVKLKQYFPFTIDDSIINYKAFSYWFDIRMDAVGRSPCWFTGTWGSLGTWCWQQQAPTWLERWGWRAAEPTLCCLNGFHIKVLWKARDTAATVHKPLVALPASLFGLRLVLASPRSPLWLLVWCGRLAAAALLGLPFSPGAPPGSGKEQARVRLKTG